MWHVLEQCSLALSALSSYSIKQCGLLHANVLFWMTNPDVWVLDWGLQQCEFLICDSNICSSCDCLIIASVAVIVDLALNF